MSPVSNNTLCEHLEQVSLHALGALPADEAVLLEAHVEQCPQCQRELAALRSVVDSFVFWPTDVLRPPRSLAARLAERIAGESTTAFASATPSGWTEPAWEKATPGILVKVLARDEERDRITMLVRLAPGVGYPPHKHVGVEELHLLDGELWINDRKLYPGDYNRSEPGTMDHRVWTETGCTCLLIASASDELR